MTTIDRAILAALASDEEAECPFCGGDGGVHRVLTRRDGKAARCSGGDLRVVVVELAAERARTDALVASLPKCDHEFDGRKCAEPATNSARGAMRFCDEHSPVEKGHNDYDYPRAAPLRAIREARAKTQLDKYATEESERMRQLVEAHGLRAGDWALIDEVVALLPGRDGYPAGEWFTKLDELLKRRP